MSWTQEQIHELVMAQRTFFRSGQTLDVKWRIEQLKKLKKAVKDHTEELENALLLDLGRSKVEAYFCDIGSLILEINEAIHGVKKWARPEKHFSGLHCFPSRQTRVYKMPYGVSLIVSPFNFPILLSLGILTSSIAGGNTAVIKASSKSPNCTALLQKMIEEIFPPEYVTVIDGGHEAADFCLEERFDKIFYTGSPNVGIHVLQSAAKNITPVALELGGVNGNWCIVRKDADLKDAARKIAFFKTCNSGQICFNINQVAVAEDIAEDFIEALKESFRKQIGEDAIHNDEYPHLISAAAYEKCSAEAEIYRDRIVYGGDGDAETLRYGPTLIYPVSKEEEIVRHELFNPLLPIVPFKDEEVDQLLDTIADREHGLALYLFTKDMDWANNTMRTQQFGSGCINEVGIHFLTRGVPFNGVGHSGMGVSHGVWGFREFTHPTTVLKGSTHMNLKLREHPYKGFFRKYKLWIIKLLER